MRSRSNYLIQVITAGFLVLVFLSLSLFWARLVCTSVLAGIMPMDYRAVVITPSGLVPAAIESDPNVVRHSRVHARIMHGAPQALGIANYISDKAPEGRNSIIYYFDPEDENPAWIYFDERTGQINCRWPDVERMPDGTVKRQMVQIYVGPEGISEIPDEDIGRFNSLIVDVSDIGWGQLTLYDKKLRQFFAVKWLT